jgi:hypothetical protein
MIKENEEITTNKKNNLGFIPISSLSYKRTK